jgi:SWR1-complex protein 3
MELCESVGHEICELASDDGTWLKRVVVLGELSLESLGLWQSLCEVVKLCHSCDNLLYPVYCANVPLCSTVPSYAVPTLCRCTRCRFCYSWRLHFHFHFQFPAAANCEPVLSQQTTCTGNWHMVGYSILSSFQLQLSAPLYIPYHRAMSVDVSAVKDGTPETGSKVAGVGSKSSSLVLIRPLESVSKELIYQQRMNRPFKVIQNLPLHKDHQSVPDFSTLAHPLSVKDSGVLYSSLIVSRFNWSYHIFNTYWTRKEQVLMGSDSKKKDRMVRFCDAQIFCGVHTFDVKLFFLKDDEREKAFREEQERRKEEKMLKRKQKQEEAQRKREEKERLDKEKELQREKLKQEKQEKLELQMKIKNENEIEKQQQQQLKINITQVPTKPQSQPESSAILPSGAPAAVKDVAKQSLPEKTDADVKTDIQNQNDTEGKENGDTENHKDTEHDTSKGIDNDDAGETGKDSNKGNKDTTPDVSEKTSAVVHNNSINSTEKNINVEVKTGSASTNSEQSTEKSVAASHAPKKLSSEAKDIMANPESAIMIQNLNYMAKQNPYLNSLMKVVASGTSTTEQILEFQKYINQAKSMGDVTGYMQKLKLKQKQKQKDPATSKTSLVDKEIKKEKVVKPKPERPKITLSPEEIRKQNELNRINQERAREEKQRLREEREKQKILEKQERIERKKKERLEREALKHQQREEKEREREMKRQEKLAEKEKARLEREEKAREKQLQKEKEKELKKNKVVESDDEDLDENFDDRMAKLNNTETNEDIWNDKLTPLQERYSTGASLVFEFQENSSARFIIPRDSIFELIENENGEDDGKKPTDEASDTVSSEQNEPTSVKEENTEDTLRPASPYVTILASFLLVHNQKEIDGWDRRRAEEARAKEEAERLKQEIIKKEEEESKNNTIAENARKRRRKKTSWGSNKRSTRTSKNAKEIEQLRREEENYHEEDEDLRKEENGSVEDVRPTPVYSCATITLSKIPFRFADFVLHSGNGPEVSRRNMEEVMKIGKRMELDQLWYQLDGIKDELLAETLRYNLNRLDYSNCGAKKNKVMFLKKFGRGGRS